MEQTPKSIIIVGSGVFGLTTAWALTKRPRFANTQITIVDDVRGGTFPPEDAASVDLSRVIRADYADADYAALGAEAQRLWREKGDEKIGGQGRYSETGIVVMANHGPPAEKGKKNGMYYAKGSYENVAEIARREGFADKVVEFDSREKLQKLVRTKGNPGDWGYLNKLSGWANNGEAMKWFYRQVQATGRIDFVDAKVEQLTTKGKRVTGVKLTDGRLLEADLVYCAAGAWSGALIDLRGRCEATGHIMAYINITKEEQEYMEKRPVTINFKTGHFIIPPENRVLKTARHGFGYLNPQVQPYALPLSPSLERKPIVASVPKTHRDDSNEALPFEADADLRKGLYNMTPYETMSTRTWCKTKICWYSDTRDAEWLVDWHPGWEGLFVATGDSGHGFKFLPVIGDKLVDTLEGKGGRLAQKWRWKEIEDDGLGSDRSGKYEGLITWDGSRGGKPGMILEEEFKKGQKIMASEKMRSKL